MNTKTVFFSQPTHSFQPNAAFLAAVHLLQGLYFPSAKIHKDGDRVVASEEMLVDSTVNTFTISQHDSGRCSMTHSVGSEEAERHWVRFDEIEPDRIECVRYHPLIGETRAMIPEVDAPVMVDMIRSIVGLKLMPEVKHAQPLPVPGAPQQEGAAIDPAKAEYRLAKICFAEAISSLKAANFPRKTLPARDGDTVSHRAEFSRDGVQHEIGVTHSIDGVLLTHLKSENGKTSFSTFQANNNGGVTYKCEIDGDTMKGSFPPGETNITDLLKRSISGKLPGIRVTQVLSITPTH
jgi:hypothetical protein